MYWITLLRHGESAGNANGQIQGQSDPPLTEKGLEQAVSLAKTWSMEARQYHQIIASPLERARHTAEIIAQELALPIEFDPAWMERGFGDIEGRIFAEILQESPMPDFNHPYRAPSGGGESIVDVYNRASQALQNLLLKPKGAYLVVSHGALLNMTMYAILGVSPHNSPGSPRFIFQNTGFVDLTYNPELHQWRLLRFWGSEPTFL